MYNASLVSFMSEILLSMFLSTFSILCKDMMEPENAKSASTGPKHYNTRDASAECKSARDVGIMFK